MTFSGTTTYGDPSKAESVDSAELRELLRSVLTSDRRTIPRGKGTVWGFLYVESSNESRTLVIFEDPPWIHDDNSDTYFKLLAKELRLLTVFLQPVKS